jgi:HK97 family phage major capsid protein
MPASMLNGLHDERQLLLAQVDQITDRAESEDRDLSDSDREIIRQHHSRIDAIDPMIEELEGMEILRGKHVDRLPVPARSSSSALAVSEPAGPDEIYRTFAQYARDVIVSRYDGIAQLAGGAPARAAAEERISRVMANTLSSDLAGLIPPQYLTQIAQVIDKSRPIVDSARRIGLTSGQLMYPSIASKPLVGKQTAEKTEAPSQTMSVTFVQVVADTYVGAGDLSWQAINWSTPDALTLWFDLAAEQYARQTEAAAGTVLGAATLLASPVIPATPALADWIAAITTAAGVIYTASNRRPDTVYADIATGYSIMGLVANVAPVFFSSGQFSLASGQGNIAGLRLVISRGLAAKTVVVADSQALLAAETGGAPVELRAVEPKLGGMEVGVIGAFVAKLIDAGAARKLTIT